MEKAVVDARAARMRLLANMACVRVRHTGAHTRKKKEYTHEFLNLLGIRGINVRRERVLLLVDNLERVGHAVDANDGKHGAENLLRHQPRRGARVEHNGRRQKLVLPVSSGQAALDHLAAVRVVKQAYHAVKVAFVHDARHGVGLLHIIAVKLLHIGLELAHELVLDRVVNEQVIRRNARLAHVEHLRAQNATSAHLNVAVFGKVQRRFAAQLERHRRQVLGGSAQHHTPHGAIARVENVVPLFLQQRRSLGGGAFDDTHHARVEVLRNELAQKLFALRGHFRRLDHRRAPGRNGRHERHQRQRNGACRVSFLINVCARCT